MLETGKIYQKAAMTLLGMLTATLAMPASRSTSSAATCFVYSVR